MSTEIFANLKFPPRHYQRAALTNFLAYLDQPKSLPIHLLFNMATGSGKTYVMAAAMLELYRRGYRNFIFFVNSTNILTKTRDNFLHQNSPKYLFNPHIMLDGAHIKIQEVENFSASQPQSINLLFTTTQRLHSDLNCPRENRLTYAELARQNIVLIGDEAHHNNINSLRDNHNKNWESTVARILAENPHSILLEFTATLDYESPAIKAKYQDRVIYRYDLREMCTEKYSKEIILYTVDDESAEREIQALILSEYRQFLAREHHIALKPVILFKSRTVYENKTNFTDFQLLLLNLTADKLAEISQRATGILQQAFDFFCEQGIDFAKLCQMLQRDFCPDKILRVDGGQNLSPAQQTAINTLEAPDNFYRAIFAVDMLKEGWDVLNLFDIVRLYETRDGKVKNGVFVPGKTTISEAQLIGRGARYCPFTYGDNNPQFRRKFDDTKSELRILEQLFYHAKHDVKYISDIKSTLKDFGLMNIVPAKRSQTKVSAKTASHFHLPQTLDIILPSGLQSEEQVFIKSSPLKSKFTTRELKLSDLPSNILHAAINRNPNFRFCKLQQLGYRSQNDFLTELRHIKLTIYILQEVNSFSPAQLLYIADETLRQIAPSSKLDI